MRPNIAVVSDTLSPRETIDLLRPHLHGRQRLFPIVDDGDRLVGLITGQDVEAMARGERDELGVRQPIVVAFPDENLRTVVQRMAETGLTRFPVVDRRDNRLQGIVALNDLLKARVRNLEAERRRERILEIKVRFPRRRPDEAERIA